MTHQEAYEMLEALTFGTLENEEADRVEAHLETGCTECIERYRELAELSARLASAVPQREPSPRIKSKLFNRIRGDTVEKQTPPIRRGNYAGWFTAALAASVAIFLFIQMTQMRDRVARWEEDIAGRDQEITTLKKELATQLEEFSALGDKLSQSREETAAFRREVEDMREGFISMERDLANRQQELETMRRDLAAYEDATLLLGQPGMQFVDLNGVEPNAQAFGKVVIDPNRGTGVVYMYRLPQTPEGMEYQLWVLREGKPTSVGTFTVADDGSAMLSMKSIPSPVEIASFNVTIEPEGGMPEPTGMMYLTGPDLP